MRQDSEQLFCPEQVEPAQQMVADVTKGVTLKRLHTAAAQWQAGQAQCRLPAPIEPASGNQWSDMLPKSRLGKAVSAPAQRMAVRDRGRAPRSALCSVEVHLLAAVVRHEHVVALLDARLDQLAVGRSSARPDSDDLCLLHLHAARRLFLHCKLVGHKP